MQANWAKGKWRVRHTHISFILKAEGQIQIKVTFLVSLYLEHHFSLFLSLCFQRVGHAIVAMGRMKPFTAEGQKPESDGAEP